MSSFFIVLDVPGRAGGMSREAGGPAPLHRVRRERRMHRQNIIKDDV